MQPCTLRLCLVPKPIENGKKKQWNRWKYEVQGLGLMSLFGDFEQHLQIYVGYYIPNSRVMFMWDIYQPLKYMNLGSVASCLFLTDCE